MPPTDPIGAKLLREGVLRLLRRDNWSVARVAAEVGTTPATVYAWRSGRSRSVSRAYRAAVQRVLRKEGLL